MEIIRYEWKYIFDEANKKNPFTIIPKELYEAPETLSKFYALTDHSLEALLDGYVYATHPAEFNDLFDCNEKLIEYDDDQMITAFLNPALPREEIKQLLREKRAELHNDIQLMFRDIIYRKWGVCSMTSNGNNLLMWSYYTKNEGFLIEFDYKTFPFKFHGPFPVNYQNKIIPVTVSECGGLGIPLLYQATIKHDR